MIKKLLIPILILFLSATAFAGFVQQKKRIIMSQDPCIGEFCSDWNDVAVDDEVCAGGCPDTWDSLTDASTKMSVDTTGDQIQYTADSTAVAYLTEDVDVAAWTEATFTFTIELSNENPHNSNGSNIVLKVFNAAGTPEGLCWFSLYDSGAPQLRVGRATWDFEDTYSSTYTDIATTNATEYDCYMYIKRSTNDSTADGYCEVGIYDDTSAWIKRGDSGMINYKHWNDHGDADKIQFGAPGNEWTDNSITIKYDDFKAYNSDQRP